ncbi:AraC family transcriptional regulator [Psychromonas ossibalaenae]|uniref:AraC family transcriptional regulator n=1 Tax=Psychromonas ossibalaenae TaxID=444922 RepID=UPI0003814EAA|nr:AraC family transcriptional regulator [Psychromonas ossibalaenae]
MAKEQLAYWRNPALPDIELTLASVKNFEFERHIHLDYHIGAVSTGCMQYLHHGNNYLMGTGLLSTINPDEVHTGASESENGYAGHFMAVPPQYISRISRELKMPEAFFTQPLIDDPYLYQAFMYLHSIAVSDQNAAQHLQLETVMMAFTTELLQRYGGRATQTCKMTGKLSCLQIKQIKDMFHADPSQSFVLQELAEPLGLSKFQFLRQFKQSMGMTPHAYFKRIRLEYAKKALIKGSDIADVAHQVGFFDQSHLNKAFKQAYLVTPNNFLQSFV